MTVIYDIEPEKETLKEKTKDKNRYSSEKAACRLYVHGVIPEVEGSLRWERFVKRVGLSPLP